MSDLRHIKTNCFNYLHYILSDNKYSEKVKIFPTGDLSLIPHDLAKILIDFLYHSVVKFCVILIENFHGIEKVR